MNTINASLLTRSVYLAAIGLLSLALGCSQQARKESHLERANDYYESQKLEEAGLEYMNVLRLDPTNHIAIRNLGLIYQAQGRPMHAFSFLQKAKELQPDDLEVRLELGRFFYAGRKFDDAQLEAKFILGKQPNHGNALVLLADSSVNSNAIRNAFSELEQMRASAGQVPGFHLALGTLHVRQGNLDKAEAAFRAALALDAKSTEANVGLARIALARDDKAQADAFFKAAFELSPLRSVIRLRYADFKSRLGDTNAAKTILDELTQKVPDYIPAWMYLAEAVFGQKRYDDCLSAIKKILDRDRGNIEALVLRGRVYLAQGQAAQAVAELEQTAGSFPNVPQVHFYLGLARDMNKDMGGALSSLNKAVQLSPNYTEALLVLAELNIRNGNQTSAIISLNRLIKENPGIVQAHYLLANAYVGRGSQEDAIAVYRDMMTLFPNNPEPPLLMGGLHLMKGNTNDARQVFEKSLEINAGYLPAAEQLIDLDIAAKRFDLALTRAQQLVEKYPQSSPVLILTAKAHWAQTNFLAAESALKQAMALDPNSRTAYMMLARVYLQSNKVQEALDKLKGVLEKNPGDVATLTQMAMIHDLMKDHAAARDKYEALLKINPNSSTILNNLAYLYSEHLNDFNRGYDMARRARELNPSDPNTADTLGWILFKRGEYPWALSLIQESVDNFPRPNAEVMYHLGMAHYMMGDEAAARSAFVRALQLGSAFPGREDMELRLRYLNLDATTATAAGVDELTSALRRDPGDPVILARLAAIYERDGQIQNALQAYQTALKQNPKNLGAMVHLARLYSERLQDPAKALALAKEARNLAPDDAHVAHLVGRMVYGAGDHAWGLSLLQESARKLSGQAGLFHDLGLAYFSVGRVPEAQTAMRQALQLNPEFPNADQARLLISMSDLILTPDKSVQAADLVAAALQSNPTFAPAIMASAVIHQRTGNVKEARQQYESLLAKHKLFVPARKQLAILLVDPLKDYQGAYEHAIQAREAFPLDPELAKALGIVMYHRKDFNRAVQLLREATDQRPTDADAFYYLGMAHVELDQKSEGVRSIRKALELNAEGAFAAEANRVLLEQTTTN